MVLTSFSLNSPLKEISYKINNFYEKLEYLRIRNHLRIVEKELLSKDTLHLSDIQKANRISNIRFLREYYLMGVFPKNTDFSDRRIPYFQDEFGTLCAMAYLVQRSGREDIIKEIRNTNNNIYIKDVKKGKLIEWINTSGLTKEEAARIQPTYGFNPDPTPALTNASIIAWILSALTFIILEVMSYKLASYVANGSQRRRLLVWFYLTVLNLIPVLVIWYISYTFFYSSSRYWY